MLQCRVISTLPAYFVSNHRRSFLWPSDTTWVGKLGAHARDRAARERCADTRPRAASHTVTNRCRIRAMAARTVWITRRHCRCLRAPEARDPRSSTNSLPSAVSLTFYLPVDARCTKFIGTENSMTIWIFFLQSDSFSETGLVFFQIFRTFCLAVDDLRKIIGTKQGWPVFLSIRCILLI